jgi:hypothetical protein
MPNVDSATGVTPVRYLSGAPYAGAVNRYCVPASDTDPIYIGSLVKLAGSADADGVPTVAIIAATGSLTIGPVVSVEAATPDSLVYRAASTLRYVYVADDPNLVHSVQCNGTLTATMIGNVCDLSPATTGSTTTGRSLTEALLSSVSASGDGTEDFLIVRADPRVGNELGADARIWVRLNNHSFVDAAAGQ